MFWFFFFFFLQDHKSQIYLKLWSVAVKMHHAHSREATKQMLASHLYQVSIMHIEKILSFWLSKGLHSFHYLLYISLSLPLFYKCFHSHFCTWQNTLSLFWTPSGYAFISKLRFFKTWNSLKLMLWTIKNLIINPLTVNKPIINVGLILWLELFIFNFVNFCWVKSNFA